MSFPRYPAYKDSGVEWLGNVPSHWRTVPVKRHFNVVGGSTPKSDAPEFWDGSVVWVTPADLSRLTSFEISSSIRTITEAGLQSCGTTLVPPGSVVLSTRAPIGSLGIAGQELCTNQGCKALVPLEDQSARFLAYLLSVNAAELNIRGRGTTFLELSADELGAFIVPAPPLPEQTGIADFLDHETTKIDALVAEQERLIELLKEKRQAVISHAVTKGLDPSVLMKDSGVEWLGEVPAHWDVSPLKYLARIGNGSTPNRDNPDYWAEEGFPWLNSSVVNHSEVSEAERFVTTAALKECHLPIIEPPAVLIGITGQGKTRGMAAPLTFTATVNQHLAYVKPDQERLGVDFLLRALEAAYEHLRTESEGVGSTKGAITCGQLGAWFMPVPDIPEQAKIVAFLTGELGKLDALTEEAERGIAYLQERRTALISAAVTGQIDVRGWVPAEAVA